MMAIEKDQWVAIGRHVVTAVSAGTAVLVISGRLNQSDAQSIGSAVNTIITAIGIIAPIAMATWSAMSASWGSRIKAVNAGDNGVKVVAATEAVPTVNAPLK